MENKKLTKALTKLIQQVLVNDRQKSDLVTVRDLRLQIRRERLTETSEWSDEDLNLVEVHAAQFNGDHSIDKILAISKYDAAPLMESVGAICAPSPFAWT